MEATILYSSAGIASQILLSLDRDYYLVDVGDGTLRDLISLKIDFLNLKGIFITHGHFDHVSGLHAIIGHLRVIERKSMMRIIYPKKCIEAREIIHAFQRCYHDFSFQIKTQEVERGDEINLKGLKIKIFQMQHWAAVGVNRILHPDVAVGYQFIQNDKTIAISGDTGMCPGLIELVRGVDEAYIDSTLTEAEVTDEILTYLHLSRKRAEKIGKLAKKYIPIHLQQNG